MRAIVIARPGGPEVLELRDLPDPVPSRGEVLVRVRATAVNRADLLQRIGVYPAPPDAPADVPGLEFAGEVEAIGEGVTELAPGDRVFGLAGGGTYAEKIVLHARALARIPPLLGLVEAAAVPEAFVTAFDALVGRARLLPGETVLVSAVGSGVGTAAVQLVRAMGARSIGTSRTEEKLERAVALGMDESIVAKGGTFAARVRELTDGRGVDVVLELVGGRYVAEDVACMAPRGRLVVVGLTGGAHADLDLAAVLRKRLEIHGTVLRSRPLEEKIAVTTAFARHVVPLFARGVLRPVVDRVLPLDAAAEAHRALEANVAFGKIVLET